MICINTHLNGNMIRYLADFGSEVHDIRNGRKQARYRITWTGGPEPVIEVEEKFTN